MTDRELPPDGDGAEPGYDPPSEPGGAVGSSDVHGNGPYADSEEAYEEYSLLDRIADWAGDPMVRVGVVAGVGGLLVGLILGVCVSGDDGEPVAVPASTTTTEPVAGVETTTTLPEAQPETTTTTLPALETNPLDGMPLGITEPRRIVAAKVDNAPAAFPQIGIGNAEMVIEVPVEGGLTRLTAVFYENVPLAVGPIRSVRPVDADLLAPMRPMLFTTGGRDFVTPQLEGVGIGLIGLDVDGGYTVVDRPEPHHYVALTDVVERIGGDIPPTRGMFTFGEGFSSEADAGAVTIPFSSATEVVWRFEDQRWVRAQNGETSAVRPGIDEPGEPFTADTVVVISVAGRPAGYLDSSGAEVPDFDVIGSGDAMVFHDGGVVRGGWLRGAHDEPWRLTDADGATMTLPPGRVFVEIVPRTVDIAVG